MNLALDTQPEADSGQNPILQDKYTAPMNSIQTISLSLRATACFMGLSFCHLG